MNFASAIDACAPSVVITTRVDVCGWMVHSQRVGWSPAALPSAIAVAFPAVETFALPQSSGRSASLATIHLESERGRALLHSPPNHCLRRAGFPDVRAADRRGEP